MHRIVKKGAEICKYPIQKISITRSGMGLLRFHLGTFPDTQVDQCANIKLDSRLYSC